ncbi:hypothetical protein CYMTET_56261 [Cymbomonas tetramitiformis]|uniref:SGNH hydrolase-type esterase domain-containing protein n=1 Tax=Cymbomonas tetramitiformis TaxID=36881 RepID=A0AAE0BBM4_9CHLO|nr:hypothetical protein CYMTET_56261 [Cymbomonas tetramitiformis]
MRSELRALRPLAGVPAEFAHSREQRVTHSENGCAGNQQKNGQYSQLWFYSVLAFCAAALAFACFHATVGIKSSQAEVDSDPKAFTAVEPKTLESQVLQTREVVSGMSTSPNMHTLNTLWTDATELGLYGTGFAPTGKLSPYDRLPEGAWATVNGAVWSLSRDSAGMFVQFLSNASIIHLNASYLYESSTNWHFPSTGLAGLDLYAWAPANATWRWVATTQDNRFHPFGRTNSLHTFRRASLLVKYRLHLPLYNGLRRLQLSGSGGVLVPDAEYSSPPPIVWYGTSVTQGAVASRPGMAFTNSLSRSLGREVLNFGFSGSGKMELGVAHWLRQIAAAAFVIDCNWNMDSSLIANRTVPLVRYLREVHSTTPIILAEDTTNGEAWAVPHAAAAQEARRAALRGAYEELLAAGDAAVYYIRGIDLFSFPPSVAEDPQHLISPTADRCHPTDLGMLAIAAHYERVLPAILGNKTTLPQWRSVTTPQHDAVSPDRPRSATEEDPAAHSWHREALAALARESDRHDSTSDMISWRWTDAQHELGAMGRAFDDTASYYDRLPRAAERTVRADVWLLSRHPAGMAIPFVTSASALAINYTLGDSAAPLWNMPMSATAGADLHAFDEAAGEYRYVATLHKFPPRAGESFAYQLVSGLSPAPPLGRRFLLFLPLRTQTLHVAIGTPHGEGELRRDPVFSSDGISFEARKPIVWYGTGITQGGAVSRPGAAYTNLLSCALGRWILNFGFTDNGEMELDVAAYLAELQPALFVIDCLANMNATLITKRTAPFVHFLRSQHPETPILLVTGTTYGSHWLDHESNDVKWRALLSEYNKLVAQGYTRLHLLENSHDQLFARNELINPTVEGIHPSDLGHREIATFYTRYLPNLLQDDA